MTRRDIKILDLYSNMLVDHILKLIEKERFIDEENTLILNIAVRNLEWMMDEIQQSEK